MLNKGQWRFVGASARSSLRVIGIALLILAALTAALAGLQNLADVGTVTLIYLIAVLFAAIRGGIFPAVVTALVAVAAAAFFFYPPIYDFRVHNPIHLIDLVLFIIVAVVTGKLATDVRRARMREQADALREALIGSVSHELRTPLSSIIGSASVLAQSAEIANHHQLAPLVKGLSEEAERLNDHIQNLLDATRISSEGIRPRAEWVDPGDIVNAAVERKKKLLAGYRLDVAVADDLPLLRLDPMLVEKALGQLIENAVKYSPLNSTIEIAAHQSSGMIKFAVKDEGTGISSDEMDRIWDRFFRSPRHRDVQGSGLGLWIARALVTACDGRVEAHSAGIGRGATVALYLPVQPGPKPTRVEPTDE
ncbi:MAG: two-component system, OmpR family, sensor histidine kinase KdpD [Alphaproteobacteria bacterium]|jgi:two-component system sensor histidine kinase KdpD|nr:two-component system, OmpR family, sensor histidine kinase KdpD [Alphaproteobacteria bacterium]